MNTGIRYLNGTIEALGTTRRQRINCNDEVRICLIDNSFYNFRRFHSGLRHNSRCNRTDEIDLFAAVSSRPVFPDDMTGNHHIIDNVRPQCIRRHITIAKSDNQD